MISFFTLVILFYLFYKPSHYLVRTKKYMRNYLFIPEKTTVQNVCAARNNLSMSVQVTTISTSLRNQFGFFKKNQSLFYLRRLDYHLYSTG